MKLEHITFTRYIAALSVVFFHFGENIFPASIDWLNPAITAGPNAVCYFFVLSGFIMAIAYYKPGTDHANTGRPLNKKKYWLARFARIYPVYLLALALVIAANLKGEGKDPATVLLSLSMLQAWVPDYALTLNSPGWSLSVEAFFYLAFPFLLILIQKKITRLLWVFALMLWLLTQLLQTYLRNLPEYQAFSPLHEFIYYFPLMHFSVFLLGLLVGVYFCDGHLKPLARPFVNGILLLLTSLFILLFLVMEPHLEKLLGFFIDYNNGMLAPLFILFIVLLAFNQGWLARLFSLPLLVLLGEASYSLYILQRPIYGIYTRTLENWLPLGETTHFYLFVLILTLISVLSFKYLETPLRSLINSWYPSSGQRAIS